MRRILILWLIGISISVIAGTPRKWDVRFNEGANSSVIDRFEIVTRFGETTDLEPRYLDSGKPIVISSNAFVRAYFREWGSTNSFVASSATGTVYTTAINRGRVKIPVIDTDFASLTNEFYVGTENGGMNYSAWGKLIVEPGPGINATTNTNGRLVFDWSTIDNINLGDAPFEVQININVRAEQYEVGKYRLYEITED